ncbi:UNVERIFIED_CONTAM: hypothetical protein Slati_2993500 [Sesamum latifolium]|uniref:Reverse transcriptase RNase H-like domain-containing protein n=1 Tax=Sesamum latifolium TaxID=2727402 RepID=A0AAW2VFD8_9LAMI
MLQGAEKRYSQIEKLALALVITARKLRPYFQSHKVIVLTNQPLKHIMMRPDASGRLVKWAVKLEEYDIEYQGRNAIKAQVLTDFVVEFAGEQGQEGKGGWLLHVDGSSNASNRGAGVLLQVGIGSRDKRVKCVHGFPTGSYAEKEVQVIENSDSWKGDFMNYLRDGTLPSDPIKAKRIKFKGTRFTVVGNDLYKRTIGGPLLKCLDEERAKYVLREVHEGSCGNHSGGRSLAQKVTRQGYFWPTLAKDATEFTKKCESCQRFASLIHTPATPMEPIRIACPFDQWGIDILGPFPPAAAQKKFIVVAMEYFSKWVEAEALAKITEKETRLEGAKSSWIEELLGVLWAYRTTPRSATGETPFCLVYGTEAIILAEIGEKTQRVAQYEAERNKEEWAFNLTVIDERRDAAYAKILHHKGLMMRSYNRRIKPICFQVGDLVLKKVEVSKYVGKLDPGWEGPFKVIKIKKPGTYMLQDIEENDLARPWNVHNLKGSTPEC